MSGIDSSIASTGLTEAEERLTADIETWLRETSPDDSKLVDIRFSHLRSLGEAVFSYPSIRDTQFLKGIIRDEGQLAESLRNFSPSSRVLHIPTKVVAIRSFLVAKFHAFSLLLYLTGSREDFQTEIRSVIFSVVSTLITEEVYFSCLEDPGFSYKTKSGLTDDLIALWDSGVDLRGIRHLSALSSLWLAREAAPPSFGTMDGNTELLRITIDLDDDWRDFLMVESGNNEARWALEEFLFGLSWEEIKEVRSTLSRFGISAVNYSQVRSYLDSRPAFSEVDDKDPRAFYDFFIERRDACAFRKKTLAPGPRHTLEEIYLKYRIITELR
ncbi:MAG: hypothetical protein LBU85_01630 [Treponema sp.]|jgi:hypothetical protein|nr:hypothetical protein [Treponema sp.]